jgi:hypothetical protein
VRIVCCQWSVGRGLCGRNAPLIEQVGYGTSGRLCRIPCGMALPYRHRPLEIRLRLTRSKLQAQPTSEELFR